MAMFRRKPSTDEERQPAGDRRRTKRQHIGWESQYTVVDDLREVVYVTSDDYTPCILHNLSMDGAAIELADDAVVVGDRVLLDLPLGERTRGKIKVRGEIRHTTPDPGGQFNVGVEFHEVGDLERALLFRLLRDIKQGVPQNA
jgi:hypothetical protein